MDPARTRDAHPCPECDGEGVIQERRDDCYYIPEHKCSECDGTGVEPTPDESVRRYRQTRAQEAELGRFNTQLRAAPDLVSPRSFRPYAFGILAALLAAAVLALVVG